MKTEVRYDTKNGMFEVTVYSSFENRSEVEAAAAEALLDAKIPECVKSYSLKNYRMSRYEANPLIAEFFQSARLNFSVHDVARMDWLSIDELIRFVRARSVVIVI